MVVIGIALAAFVQESGLERIRTSVMAALRRGGRVRLVTGDYLEVTQASALEALLDLERACAADDGDEDEELTGTLETRVVEVE